MLVFSLMKKEKKGCGFGWVQKDRGGVEGGEAAIRTHCMKNPFSIKNRREKICVEITGECVFACFRMGVGLLCASFALPLNVPF